MFGGVVLVVVLAAALLTRYSGRAPGMEPDESATHDGARAASHNAELGRGGLGG